MDACEGPASCGIQISGGIHSRKPVLVAVGPSGSDYSTDDGASWSSIESPGYHALSFARASSEGWAVGETGRIGKLASRFLKSK